MIGEAVVGVLAGESAGGAYGRWTKYADRYWHKSSVCLLLVAVTRHSGWVVPAEAFAGLVGWVFGGGWLSPDQDQCRRWRKVATFPERLIKTRSLFRPVLAPVGRVLRGLYRAVGSPLDHHRVTHAVMIHVGLIVLAVDLLPWWLPVWLVPAAWLGHDLGDALMGRRYEGEAGPAWILWWGCWGLGIFKSGGPTCRVLTVACWPVTCWLLWSGLPH